MGATQLENGDSVKLAPRLPRGVSKIPRQVFGTGGDETNGQTMSNHTIYHHHSNSNNHNYHHNRIYYRRQQQQQQVDSSRTPTTTRVSHDNMKFNSSLGNDSNSSRYLTFSKDQATSHFKSLKAEFSGQKSSIVVDSELQQQQQQQQANKQIGIISPVKGGKNLNGIQDPAVATGTGIVSTLVSNITAKAPATTTTSPMTPRPLERLSKQVRTTPTNSYNDNDVDNNSDSVNIFPSAVVNHQQHHHHQPICEAFIMTGQSMLKLSCNESENNKNTGTSNETRSSGSDNQVRQTESRAKSLSLNKLNSSNNSDKVCGSSCGIGGSISNSNGVGARNEDIVHRRSPIPEAKPANSVDISRVEKETAPISIHANSSPFEIVGRDDKRPSISASQADEPPRLATRVLGMAMATTNMRAAPATESNSNSNSARGIAAGRNSVSGSGGNAATTGDAKSDGCGDNNNNATNICAPFAHQTATSMAQTTASTTTTIISPSKTEPDAKVRQRPEATNEQRGSSQYRTDLSEARPFNWRPEVETENCLTASRDHLDRSATSELQQRPSGVRRRIFEEEPSPIVAVSVERIYFNEKERIPSRMVAHHQSMPLDVDSDLKVGINEDSTNKRQALVHENEYMEFSHEDSVQEGSEEAQSPSTMQPACNDRDSARRLAKRLYNLSGFKRSDVCHHLSKNNPFSQMVAEEYLNLFDFRSMKLDSALRKFLSKLQLNGETQERERLLSQFSLRYYDCNKEKFPSAGTVQTLVCALILLNQDLHGGHHKKKRSKLSLGAFIDGLNNSLTSSITNDGDELKPNGVNHQMLTPYTFPRHILIDLYESIKKRPLKCSDDNCDMTSFEAELDKIYGQQLGNNRSNTLPTRRFAPGSNAPSSTLSASSRRHLKQELSKMNSQEAENEAGIQFKSGFLNRKRVFEAHGKPTSKGRRGWRRVHVTLQDLRIIMRPNEPPDVTKNDQLTAKQKSKSRAQMLAQDMKNTVKIHHTLAKRSTTYKKREFVFHLQLANQSEFLLQAASEQELNSWIDSINFASACLSSPALASAVSNSKSHPHQSQRPLLPASYTKLSYWEQLLDHEERLQRLKVELDEHLSEAPNTKNATKKSKTEFIEKIAWLKMDIERYNIYVDLMRKKSNSPEAIILSKHPQIASLTPSNEMVLSLPSFAPPNANSVSNEHQVAQAGS